MSENPSTLPGGRVGCVRRIEIASGIRDPSNGSGTEPGVGYPPSMLLRTNTLTARIFSGDVRARAETS